MTTRAYVPNVDGEGSIGTTDKKWGAMYVASPDSMASDNRVASTAWVQKLLVDALAKQKETYEQAISTAVSAAQTKAKLDAHPVGSYYWSNDSTSPATLFGGTWEALPPGYTLIAQGSGTDDYGSFTYTAGQKYGERKHQLTTEELPKISGSVSSLIRWQNNKTQSGVLKAVEGISKFPSLQSENTSNSTVSIEFGGDAPHNNIPPVIASYAWRRTA